MRHIELRVLLHMHRVSIALIGRPILLLRMVLRIETSVMCTLELRKVRLMHVGLLSWVIGGTLRRHMGTGHYLRSHATEVAVKRLLGRRRKSTRASVIKEDTVVLCITLVLHRLLVVEVMTGRLLALETKVDLLLKLLCLLTGHKLLGVLVRISQLAATILIEILLWTDITVS